MVPEPYSNTQIMGMEEQALLVHTHTHTPTHTREEGLWLLVTVKLMPRLEFLFMSVGGGCTS